MQTFSVHKTKLSFMNNCLDKVSPDMLSLLFFKSHPMHENILSICLLVFGTPRYFLASLANAGYPFFLALHQSREFLSASKGSV